MTYENFKKGLFRLFVGLTFCLWIFAFPSFGYAPLILSNLPIKDVDMNITEIQIASSVLLWTIYFFIIWISKGFLGKK